MSLLLNEYNDDDYDDDDDDVSHQWLKLHTQLLNNTETRVKLRLLNISSYCQVYYIVYSHSGNQIILVDKKLINTAQWAIYYIGSLFCTWWRINDDDDDDDDDDGGVTSFTKLMVWLTWQTYRRWVRDMAHTIREPCTLSTTASNVLTISIFFVMMTTRQLPRMLRGVAHINEVTCSQCWAASVPRRYVS